MNVGWSEMNVDDLRKGSEILNSLRNKSHIERDKIVADLLIAGNVPTRIKQFAEIQVQFNDTEGTQHDLTMNVLPDVLCIGTDDDNVRVSLSPLEAQRVCDACDCILPTTKLSDIIWQNAVNKLAPLPWGPPYDSSMMSVERLLTHNVRINDQLFARSLDPSALTAGHKKDVVLTNVLVEKQSQVAIWGWHQSNGKPIQLLYLGHENTYADYSHGIRPVAFRIILDGVEDDIRRILQHKTLSIGVSSEGPMKILRQPLT